jgi:hypothetical protein
MWNKIHGRQAPPNTRALYINGLNFRNESWGKLHKLLSLRYFYCWFPFPFHLCIKLSLLLKLFLSYFSSSSKHLFLSLLSPLFVYLLIYLLSLFTFFIASHKIIFNNLISYLTEMCQNMKCSRVFDVATSTHFFHILAARFPTSIFTISFYGVSGRTRYRRQNTVEHRLKLPILGYRQSERNSNRKRQVLWNLKVLVFKFVQCSSPNWKFSRKSMGRINRTNVVTYYQNYQLITQVIKKMHGL